MKIEEITMTPALAATLLQANTRNRNLSQQRVTALAASVERGEWLADANPIKVSAQGVLLDGQHRLAAIVRAKSPVQVLMVTGLDESAQIALDSGRARTFADYLIIRGVNNPDLKAAITRLLWNYTNGMFTYKGSWTERPMPSLSQLWSLYQSRADDIEDAATWGRKINRMTRISRAVVGVGWLLLQAIDTEDAEDFFGQLSLDHPETASSINALKRNLENREALAVRKGQMSQKLQLALLIKAWNFYRDGTDVETLRWRAGGAAREKFPVPR